MSISRTRKLPRIGIFSALFAVCLFVTLEVYAQSKDKINQAKTKELVPKTQEEWEIEADVFDEFGGYSESYDYIIEIGSGGQPSPIGISQDPTYEILAGYVHATGGPEITVIFPNGGEYLEVNSYHDITWTSVDVATDIKIDYSINGGVTWIPITDATPNDGVYENWLVPNTPSSACLVRICDVGENVCDASDGHFMIVPACPLLTTCGVVALLILLMGTGAWILISKRQVQV